MSTHPVKVSIEPVIWARLIQSQKGEVSPETAEYLLSIQFGETDHARMEELAEHSTAGTLTPEEQAEFDSYLHIGNLLSMMQSQARTVLGRKLLGNPHS